MIYPDSNADHVFDEDAAEGGHSVHARLNWIAGASLPQMERAEQLAGERPEYAPAIQARLRSLRDAEAGKSAKISAQAAIATMAHLKPPKQTLRAIISRYWIHAAALLAFVFLLVPELREEAIAFWRGKLAPLFGLPASPLPKPLPDSTPPPVATQSGGVNP